MVKTAGRRQVQAPGGDSGVGQVTISNIFPAAAYRTTTGQWLARAESAVSLSPVTVFTPSVIAAIRRS